MKDDSNTGEQYEILKNSFFIEHLWWPFVDKTQDYSKPT